MRKFATAVTGNDPELPQVEVRNKIMEEIIMELERDNELTPTELIKQLIPYAKPLGNEGFCKWARTQIRYRIGNEYISKQLKDEIERRGITVETVTPNITEIKSAFRFVAEAESKPKAIAKHTPREPKAVRELRALGLSEEQIAKAFKKH